MQCLTMDGLFGNPASRSHRFGWQAEEAVDLARNQVAELIGADPREIVFTSGATESNNLAIKGIAHFYAGKGKHIVTSKTEHKAVLDTCRQLEREGYEVTYLEPMPNGLFTLEQIEGALRDDTILVSIMHANNEIGWCKTLLPSASCAVPARSCCTWTPSRAWARSRSTWKRSRLICSPCPPTRYTARKALAPCMCAASPVFVWKPKCTAVATSAACAPVPWQPTRSSAWGSLPHRQGRDGEREPAHHGPAPASVGWHQEHRRSLYQRGSGSACPGNLNVSFAYVEGSPSSWH